MKKILVLTTALSICFWSVAQAQDHKKEEPKKEAPKAAQPAQPTKPADAAKTGEHSDQPAEMEMKTVEITEHHKQLHDSVGTWKVEHSGWHTPGSESEKAYGTMTVKTILDGLATTVEEECTGDKGTFRGFGVFTWNPTAQKYSGTWVDNYSHNGIDPLEGTYDPATKTLTWTGSWTIPGGIKLPFRMTETQPSPDKMVMSMYMPGEDGKEFKCMENVYTRVK